MRVDIGKKVIKKVKNLPRKVANEIRQVLYEIEGFENTSMIDNDGKLKGYSDLYKIRVGDYRIVYKKVSSNHIKITNVGDRKYIYKTLLGIVFSL